MADVLVREHICKGLGAEGLIRICAKNIVEFLQSILNVRMRSQAEPKEERCALTRSMHPRLGSICTTLLDINNVDTMRRHLERVSSLLHDCISDLAILAMPIWHTVRPTRQKVLNSISLS